MPRRPRNSSNQSAPGQPATAPLALRDHAAAMAATCFGLGYLPIAPGTWGTLPGVAVHVLAVVLAPAQATWVLLASLGVACVGCIALGRWAETHWARKDPGPFVLDEVAGYLLIAVLFTTGNLLLTVVWAFGMSRLFDIIKPPPARQLERLGGGVGILVDDLVASVYAIIVLRVVRWLLPLWVGAGALAP